MAQKQLVRKRTNYKVKLVNERWELWEKKNVRDMKDQFRYSTREVSRRN